MRRQARENAFQVIFANLFLTPQDCEEKLAELKKTEDVDFAKQIINNFIENRETLTKIIGQYLVGYELERLYKTDLALLYLALSEIKYIGTPCQVVINETLEIAKKYSTEKSAKFINGVLSSIVKGQN